MNGLKLMLIKRLPEEDDGTFGVIYEEGKMHLCLTLERKWLNNQKGVSCIPEGEYICRRINSPKFGNTFEVTNVPNRSEILFHRGNIKDDSHGCIILGETFGSLHGQKAILSSGHAFDIFMLSLSGSMEFKLVIEKS